MPLLCAKLESRELFIPMDEYRQRRDYDMNTALFVFHPTDFHRHGKVTLTSLPGLLLERLSTSV